MSIYTFLYFNYWGGNNMADIKFEIKQTIGTLSESAKVGRKN